MLVPRKIFKLRELCDPEPTRFATGGIKFERLDDGTPRASVTDGRVLMIAEWQEDAAEHYPVIEGVVATEKHAFEVIVPKAACAEAEKLLAPGKRCPKPVVARNVVLDEVNTNGRVIIAASNIDDSRKITPQAIDGKFPSVMDVIPNYGAKNSVSINVDAERLIELLTAVLKTSASGNAFNEVTLTLDAEQPAEQPVMVSCVAKGDVSVCGILMPVGIERETKQAPKGRGPVWMPGRVVDRETGAEAWDKMVAAEEAKVELARDVEETQAWAEERTKLIERGQFAGYDD